MSTSTDPPRPARDRAVLALPALGISLTTFAVYQLLICFQVPPRLVFLLLLVFWPLGGAIYYALHRRLGSLERSLEILTGSIVLLYGLFLAHGGLPPLAEEAEAPLRSLWAAVLPILAVVPFFLASGYAEVALYAHGSRLLGSYVPVYALILFASAVGLPGGYLVHRALSLPALFVLGATAALVGRALWLRRPAAAGIATGLGALLVVVATVTETAWLRHTLSLHRHSQEFEQQGYRRHHEVWGRFGLFTIFRHDLDPGLGFYNDVLHWSFGDPAFDDPTWIDALPFALVGADDRVSIIGAGGGRQVHMALRAGLRNVHAVELEPAVLAYFMEIEPEANRSIYLDPGVRMTAGEGRRTVVGDPAPSTLVYIADTGASRFNFVNLLNDASFLHTVESLRAFTDVLTEDGFVASYVHRGVDPADLMRPHYEETIRAAGLETWSLVDDQGYVMFGAPPGRAPALRERLETVLAERRPDLLPVPAPAPPDRELRVGHDEHVLSQLFFAWPVERIRAISASAVRWVLGLAGLVVGLALVVDRARGRGLRRGVAGIAIAGIAVGFNFTILQVYGIGLLNARFHEIFLTTIAGSVGFLVVAGVGAGVFARRLRPPVLAVLALAALALALAPPRSPGLAIGAILAVLAAATGSFFPSVAGPEVRDLVVLFVGDAVGAMVGCVVGLVVPVLGGLSALAVVAAVGFGLALGARLVFERTDGPVTAPSGPADPAARR